MIQEFNRRSFMWGVPGVVLQHVGGFPLYFAVSTSPVVFCGCVAALAVGTVLLVMGLGYYAEAKGQSFAWGFMGFLGIVGLIVLACLPDKTKPTATKAGQLPVLKPVQYDGGACPDPMRPAHKSERQ